MSEEVSVIHFDLDKEEQAKNIKEALVQLLDFYTDPKHRYMNNVFLEKISTLPMKEQITELRLELSNVVLTFHFVHAMKAEAEKLLKEKKE